MSDRPKTAPGLAPAEWHGYALDCEERISDLLKDRVQLIEQAARDTFASNARIAELEKKRRAVRSPADVLAVLQMKARIVELEDFILRNCDPFDMTLPDAEFFTSIKDSG